MFCTLFCLAFIFGVLVIPANAAVYTMDNDALPGSGVTNPKKQGESYGWFNMDYITNDNYVNDDARRGRSYIPGGMNGSYGSRYCWERSFPTANMDLYVYLWDTSFTDPAAHYETLATLSGSSFGKLDQNHADYGWNYVESASNVTKNLFAVTSSGKAGTYLGADAIQVRYWPVP